MVDRSSDEQEALPAINCLCLDDITGGHFYISNREKS